MIPFITDFIDEVLDFFTDAYENGYMFLAIIGLIIALIYIIWRVI